jgi:hypothetical protein
MTVPECWGAYKDSRAECQRCRVAQSCAERLALSIVLGVGPRPSAVVMLGED